MSGIPTPFPSDGLEGDAGEESGAGLSVFLCGGVDAAEHALGEGDVEALGAAGEGGEVYGDDGPGAVGVAALPGVGLKVARGRHWEAGIEEPLDVEGHSFVGARQGFIEGVPGGEAPGEVRDLDPVGGSFFVFDGDGVVHGFGIPADLRMARAVPVGRSFFGCGTVTSPGF